MAAFARADTPQAGDVHFHPGWRLEVRGQGALQRLPLTCQCPRGPDVPLQALLSRETGLPCSSRLPQPLTASVAFQDSCERPVGGVHPSGGPGDR